MSTYYAFPGNVTPGMTLRDYFAAAAIQRMLPWEWSGDASEKFPDYANNIATTAYAVADAMLKARGV